MHPILYNSTFHVKGGAGRADVVDYDGSTNAGQRQAVCDALNIYIYVKRKATQPASVQRIFSRGCIALNTIQNMLMSTIVRLLRHKSKGWIRRTKKEEASFVRAVA